MKIRHIFAVISFIILLAACNNGQSPAKPETGKIEFAQFNTIQFDTLGYSAEVSANMKPTTGLNNDAFMQYLDSNANEFIVGIAEPKKETQFVLEAAEIWDNKISFMENYQSLTQSQLQESMTITDIPVWKKETINGMKIESSRFKAKHPDVPGELIYTAIYFENETNIFILYYWSMTYREKEYLKNVTRFINSIKKNTAD